MWLISTMYRYRPSLKLWRKIEQTLNGKLLNLSAYQIVGHAMPEEIVYGLEHYCLYHTQLRQPITFRCISWNVFIIIQTEENNIKVKHLFADLYKLLRVPSILQQSFISSMFHYSASHQTFIIFSCFFYSNIYEQYISPEQNNLCSCQTSSAPATKVGYY